MTGVRRTRTPTFAYVSSGQNWTATINNKTFTHTRNGQSHQDTRINYESGSTSYWAKVK